MKKLVFFVFLLALFSSVTYVAARTHGHKAVKVEYKDSVVQDADTASYSPDYTDSMDNDTSVVSNDDGLSDLANSELLHSSAVGRGAIVAIVAIVLGFLFPLLVIFLIFYFRYKNRKAKYLLAEKALESGKPLPEGIIAPHEAEKIFHSSLPAYNSAQRDKGIKNTFIGIGLFLFLWALTGNFGVGCIGLLVMFYGIGLWVSSEYHKQDVQQGQGYFKQNFDGSYTGRTSQETTGKGESEKSGTDIKNDSNIGVSEPSEQKEVDSEKKDETAL